MVFDGMDGSGKTSQMLLAANYLFNRSKKLDSIVLTREPTFNRVGAQIRELLKTEKDPLKSAELCLKLYTDDRRLHLKQIKQWLDAGSIVLCDRFKYVTFVYQRVQGNSLESIHAAHAGMRAPDLTLLFDLPAETAIERMNAGRFIHASEKNEKFEKLDFLQKARAGFQEMPSLFPFEKIVVLDASPSKEAVFEQVKLELDKVVKID
ncbi:MAG: dTMP kinase [Candidatus Diapherotrites archaeon]